MAARPDDLALIHHGHAAHDGAHRPALEQLVLVQAVVGVGAELGGNDLALAVEVDDGEVGVRPRRDAALDRLKVEYPSRRGGEQLADALQRQLALVIPLRDGPSKSNVF